MNQGPVSLFVAVYSFTNRQFRIIKLETAQKQQGLKTAQKQQRDVEKNLDDFEVVRFIPPNGKSPLIRWYVPPTTSSTDDLHIFPSNRSYPPLHGYKFNFTTASFRKIKPPQAQKEDAFVVNLGRLTYYICALYCHTADTDFECYDADQDKWDTLTPFPKCPYRSRIVATAAWGDTILFNVDITEIWAYNVCINKWYDVHADDNRCYDIVGKAVVLQHSEGTTIYALADRYAFSCDTVLALSIKIEGASDGPVYKLSLHSEIPVHAMDPVLDDDESVWMPTRNLLHVGKHYFCLVKACMIKGFKVYLYIQLTYMELTAGGKLAIMIERYHKLNIQDLQDLGVVQCFFLPECKATALGRGKRLDFQLDPYEYQSVCVRKFPFNATVEQLEKRLKVFGPIVRDGIQFQRKKKKCVAFVEFESAVSKQDAIKAEIVLIGDRWAEIRYKMNKRERMMMIMMRCMNQPHSSHEVDIVYVSNLPRNVTVEEVETELNVFGPIVRDGIQVIIKKTKVFAFVEFESEASKQSAIKAAIVYFGDCPANIYVIKRKMKNQPHSSGLQKDGEAQ